MERVWRREGRRCRKLVNRRIKDTIMSVTVRGSRTVIRRIRVVIVQQDVVSGIILHRVGTGNRNRCEVIVQKIRENQYRQQFFLCLP